MPPPSSSDSTLRIPDSTDPHLPSLLHDCHEVFRRLRQCVHAQPAAHSSSPMDMIQACGYLRGPVKDCISFSKACAPFKRQLDDGTTTVHEHTYLERQQKLSLCIRKYQAVMLLTYLDLEDRFDLNLLDHTHPS
ncbi:hypothetical protein HMI54_006348 [Coelomomyces lativittatus]|nr:hypothetical protein HMI55_004598 [Coelomomyces lativittatus]KAJ1505062.1 hypothetical protein HMI54_006348 [Coelomomyces lativittatus]